MKLFLFTILISTAAAFADSQVTCTYQLYQAPIASVTLTLAADGSPSPEATINMSGATHQEPVTPVALASNERIHIWLSKQDPDNAVEMIAFTQPTAQGESELINHNFPMDPDIWGSCNFSENWGR